MPAGQSPPKFGRPCVGPEQFSPATRPRYQFLETFLRAAEAKYLKPKKAERLGEAMRQMYTLLEAECAPIFQQEKDFRSHLFAEEVDLVFKANLGLLNAAYNIYAGITAA
eukprot:symbB.v1.2.032172.t1/scaffold3825.1/size49598/3